MQPSLQYLMMLFCVVICQVGTAQEAERIVAGVVLDAQTNDPLIGASIRLGKNISTTDFDGRFLLKPTYKVDSLIVSYVGYKQAKQAIPDKQDSVFMTILLTPSAQMLDAATITGSRYDKSLAKSVVSIDLIKPEFIEQNNSVAIDDILDRTPGVHVIGGQANIRGGSGFSYGAGSRVLLLVDDIPALAGDAGTAQWEDYALENIERIEILKGASSALYGSAALNGIVNLKTKYPTSVPETHIRTFYKYYMEPDDEDKIWYDQQPFETSTSLSHKQKFGRLDLVLGANWTYRDSYNQDTYTRYGRINPVIRYRITDRLIAGVNVNFNKGRGKSFLWWKGDDSDVFRASKATVRNSDRTRYMVDPYVSWFDPSGGRHKWMGRLYRVNNEVTSNQSNASDLWYGEYQYQKHFENQNTTLTTGITGTWVDSEAELFGNANYTSNNLGMYLQLDRNFFEKLEVSLGGRWERNTITNPVIYSLDTIPPNESSDDRPVLRLGVNYQLAKASFLRASWGQGYRFPTIAEKFVSANIGFPIVPNPELMPETGWSSEIGLKQGFQIEDLKGFVDLAFFWTEYQNMMEFVFVLDPFVGFQSRNIGDTRIRGIELNITTESNWNNNTISMTGGYMYLDPQFQEFTEQVQEGSSSDKNILKYRFQHSFKADLEYKKGKFHTGTNLIYNSNMEAIDLFFSEFIPGLKSWRADNNAGHFVIHWRGGYQITSHLDVTLLVENIFNREYTLRPAILEPPRNISVRADVRF